MVLSLLKINQTLPGYSWKENLLVAVLPTLTSPETAAPFEAHSPVSATAATVGWARAEENHTHPSTWIQYPRGAIS